MPMPMPMPIESIAIANRDTGLCTQSAQLRPNSKPERRMRCCVSTALCVSVSVSVTAGVGAAVKGGSRKGAETRTKQ